MSRHDANRLTYDEVTIFDVPALFTDLRVDRSTVPDGVYRYEVRYSDEYGGEPVELARGIMVDFFGTVLTREPIQLPISGGLELNDGDLDFQSGCFSLAEFQQEYPISKKQVIDFSSLKTLYFTTFATPRLRSRTRSLAVSAICAVTLAAASNSLRLGGRTRMIC